MNIKIFNKYYTITSLGGISKSYLYGQTFDASFLQEHEESPFYHNVIVICKKDHMVFVYAGYEDLWVGFNLEESYNHNLTILTSPLILTNILGKNGHNTSTIRMRLISRGIIRKRNIINVKPIFNSVYDLIDIAISLAKDIHNFDLGKRIVVPDNTIKKYYLDTNIMECVDYINNSNGHSHIFRSIKPIDKAIRYIGRSHDNMCSVFEVTDVVFENIPKYLIGEEYISDFKDDDIKPEYQNITYDVKFLLGNEKEEEEYLKLLGINDTGMLLSDWYEIVRVSKIDKKKKEK